MKNPRKYGAPPYKTAVVHGGPGAQGGVADIAIKLSDYCGVLEPLQTEYSIDGEIDELYNLIKNEGEPPVVLIGHSWGAWLSLLTAARYPEAVSKLILVSSAPFEDHYAAGIHKSRIERLSSKEKIEFSSLMQRLTASRSGEDRLLSKRLHELFLKSDFYETGDEGKDYGKNVEINSGVFNAVWHKAAKLRSTGSLLKTASNLKCPVLAIHGDHDPHPAEGVELPLKQVIKDFRFILLEKCGHYPWLEKHASEKFYNILRTELQL
ncbi:MAG TPA: alpha/beta hydrolase [Spirochaetota bacterium]|nr:alpha/beta hydrolase [Spirochaetota bacterium]